MKSACLFASFLALLAAGVGPAMSSIGLAEWSVRTPGGAVISHQDGWKEQHGDCLRSAEDDEVYVAQLRRWRYHEGYVSGETEGGYFIYDERTRHVQRLRSERAMDEALERIGAERSFSGWLTAADGWTESFFFELVWIPCLIERQGPLDEDEAKLARAAAAIAPVKCSDALSHERLVLYARTTWGRQCRDASIRKRFERASRARALRFVQLCEALARGRGPVR